jgi:hypothetical protein
MKNEKTRGQIMMGDFCKAVESGRTPDAETLAFFREAFRAIESGANPKKALALEQKRGRKAPITMERAMPYLLDAMDVIDCMEGGLSYAKACEKVSLEKHKSDKIVKAHYGKHKAYARTIMQIQKTLSAIADARTKES